MTITVGVPVYNGGSLLEESLACLAAQTHQEFRVLIYDNASTDQTPEIAQAYAACDPRFRYHRQPTNKGAVQNFIDVMEACETPLFLWRAHDDLSDANYLEVLAAAMAANPEAVLAAPRVERERVGQAGSRIRTVPFRISQRGHPTARLIENLGHVHQCWFYGLWRHAVIRQIWHRVRDAYPHAWASDFLMLFAALARDGVVGSDATAFRQRIIKKPSQDASQAAPADPEISAAQRAGFLQICAEEVGLSDRPTLERLRLQLAIQRFTSRRVGGRRLEAKRWVRRRLGLKV